MTKLTPKQIELLRKLANAGGSMKWSDLKGPENANGTRLEKAGLCRWGEPGKNQFGWPTKGALHITDAGRQALAQQS